MKFVARVIPSGNATGVEIPKGVVEALHSGARPPITVTINGHTWRSRVPLMRGQHLVGISAANRVGSGIAEGDIVVVDLKLDAAPRVATQPPDLARALRHVPGARAAFDRLPFGLKRKHERALRSVRVSEHHGSRSSRPATCTGVPWQRARADTSAAPAVVVSSTSRLHLRWPQRSRRCRARLHARGVDWVPAGR